MLCSLLCYISFHYCCHRLVFCLTMPFYLLQFRLPMPPHLLQFYPIPPTLNFFPEVAFSYFSQRFCRLRASNRIIPGGMIMTMIIAILVLIVLNTVNTSNDMYSTSSIPRILPDSAGGAPRGGVQSLSQPRSAALAAVRGVPPRVGCTL